MKLIVCSQVNIASKNMHKIFVEELGFEKTNGTFDDQPIYTKDEFTLIFMKNQILDLEYLTECFTPEVYLIASTHKSEKHVKSLSTHITGNWSEAKMGGKDKELCHGAALFMRSAFLKLKEYTDDAYDVTYEVTHHGPSEMNAPVVYVEVGSTEEEWNDIDACRQVCKAIITPIEEKPTAICFGGTHYATNFCKGYVLEKYAPGHICPKWYIDDLNSDLINQMIEKTVPRPVIALLDWKGLNGPQKDHLKALLDEAGLPWKKVSSLKEPL